MTYRLIIMVSMATFGITFILIQVFYLLSVYPFTASTTRASVSMPNGGIIQESSSCARDCTVSPYPRICNYDFVAEWYYTMSKACYNCPFNASDCLRPHCIAANGVQRPVLAINRQIPGPSIQVCQGDRVRVTVHNALDNSEGLTIHWHGQHQRSSPHMDGTSMITQCPIPRPQNFTYDFIAETPGTQFWHSHSGLQRADGLFGPMVVRQSDDAHANLYDVDDVAHVMMLSDWTDTLAMQHMMKDLHADGPGGPDGILINGHGINRKVFEKNGQSFHLPDVIFTITQGLRYRFRTINTAVTNCPIHISISKHKLLIIATDGGDIEPVEVDGVVVAGGERYDFVICTDQSIDNYAIRVRGADGSECEGIEEVAILRYRGALETRLSSDTDHDGVVFNMPVAESEPETPGVCDLRDAGPINPDIVRPEPDVKHYIEIDSVYRNSPHLHHPTYYSVEKGGHSYTSKRTHMMNNISFALPPAPLLTHHRYLPASSLCTKSTMMTDHGQDCEEEYCECIHTIDVKLNQVVELILVTKSLKEFEPHPLHLHGNHFYVISYDNGQQLPLDAIKEMDEKGEIARNLDHPPRKDTIMMAQRYAILRFKADNPGWWLLHCHMDVHLELGMAVVFHVGDDTDLPPPPSNMPVCVREHDTAKENTDARPECKLANSLDTKTSPTFIFYVITSTLLLVALAYLFLLYIHRKMKPRRNSVQYTRLPNGEIEMNWVGDNHRSVF